jgi:hypothetical protein
VLRNGKGRSSTFSCSLKQQPFSEMASAARDDDTGIVSRIPPFRGVESHHKVTGRLRKSHKTAGTAFLKRYL